MGSRHELGYAPPRSRGRRAFVWRGIAVLAAVALAWLAWHWLPPLVNQARYLSWQREALRNTRPPNGIALDVDPKDALAVLANGSEYQLVPKNWEPRFASHRRMLAAFYPRSFRKLQSDLTFSRGAPHGIAFMHERRSRDGERFLVVVPFWVYGDKFSASCYTEFGGATAYSTAGWRPHARLSPVYTSNFWVRMDPHTIHFGVPDPADESHFVLDLEVDAYSTLNPPDHFIIDGWVRDGGMLEMIPRPGPISDRIRSQPFGHSSW